MAVAAGESLRGRCLCGACGFSATVKDAGAGACHCAHCRSWSGGVFLSVDCGDSVSFDEGAPVKAYKSSDYAERLFCADCGSTLVWQMQDGSSQQVSIQALEGEFALDHEIWIDAKPAGYAFAGDHTRMTEAEVMAMFAEKG